MTIKLITKDGWVLTSFTAQKLEGDFDGTREELAEYVAKRNLQMDEQKVRVDGHPFADNLTVAVRFYIGQYDLDPGDDLVVAEKGWN